MLPSVIITAFLPRSWKKQCEGNAGRVTFILLSTLRGVASAEKRRLVGKAAAFCLETRFTVSEWQGKGVAPPELGWQAKVWEEVWDAIRPVVKLLKRLAVDPDEKVKDEAISGLSHGAKGILDVGLREESISALEFLVGLPLNASQRASLIDGVAFLMDECRRQFHSVEGEVRAALQSIIDRGEALFNRLTSADFRSRFQHWLGPAPMRSYRRVHEHANHREMKEEGKRLAQEVMADPSLFAEDLQDWVTGEQAPNAGYFFYALGELDRGIN